VQNLNAQPGFQSGVITWDAPSGSCAAASYLVEYSAPGVIGLPAPQTVTDTTVVRAQPSPPIRLLSAPAGGGGCLPANNTAAQRHRRVHNPLVPWLLLPHPSLKCLPVMQP